VASFLHRLHAAAVAGAAALLLSTGSSAVTVVTPLPVLSLVTDAGGNTFLTGNPVVTGQASIYGFPVTSVVTIGPAGGSGNLQTSGLVSMADLSTSLSSIATAPAQASGIGGLVLHGAHGRPLARRVEAGKSCFWAAGDLGDDRHESRNGAFGLAEAGGCHAFAPGIQGSLSIGRNWANQELTANGRSDVSATYGVAELLGNLPSTGLWASVAVLYQQGDLDARRGYLNAGTQDFSRGRAPLETIALRLRLDWENAATLRDVAITPYVDGSHARTRIGAYSEQGGAFPASFDLRVEKSTQLRLGADGAYPLSSSAKLTGKLESAHRFEGSGPATTGSVLGALPFNLPAQASKRDWLRAGLGFDVRTGEGVVAAMLNAATPGPVPSYWLNLSYQLPF
jgi:hypothetical protein